MCLRHDVWNDADDKCVREIIRVLLVEPRIQSQPERQKGHQRKHIIRAREHGIRKHGLRQLAAGRAGMNQQVGGDPEERADDDDKPQPFLPQVEPADQEHPHTHGHDQGIEQAETNVQDWRKVQGFGGDTDAVLAAATPPVETVDAATDIQPEPEES